MSEAIKLTEKQRIYTFPGSDKVILDNVTELRVSESGNHRIE